MAGGALLGVVFAFLNISNGIARWLTKISVEHGLTASLGKPGYDLLGVGFFAIMGGMLYYLGTRKPDIRPEHI